MTFRKNKTIFQGKSLITMVNDTKFIYVAHHCDNSHAEYVKYMLVKQGDKMGHDYVNLFSTLAYK